MIRRYVSRSVLLLILLDQGVFLASIALALFLKTHWVLADPLLPVEQHVDLFLHLWPVLAITLVVSGAYRLHQTGTGFRRLFRQTLMSAACLAAVWVMGTFYLKMNELFFYSRAVFTIFLTGSAVGIFLNRLFVVYLTKFYNVRYGRQRRVLIIGGESLGPKIARRLQKQLFVAFRVMGVTDPVDIPDVPQLGEKEALNRIRQGEVDHVVVDLPPRRIRLLLEVAKLSEREGVAMQITPSVFPDFHLKPHVEHIGKIPVMELCGGELPMSGLIIKRVIDVVVSVVGLIACAPLFVVIAIAIKATSRGPVFYLQERVGLDGMRFKMIKFRTMSVDAEAETGPIWATTNDDRATRIGRVLRRTNLDELPQFFNVLVGNMSLVGPRPERPEFVEQFKSVISRYSHKHWVKPGITGWAQVNGWRGKTDLRRRIEHDIAYVERWSLWFDFKILLLTIWRGYKNAC